MDCNFQDSIMIAWLVKIAGLLGSFLTLSATEEARRWAMRSIAFGVVALALYQAYKAFTEKVEEFLSYAFAKAVEFMGADSFSGHTLEWIRCVTPTTMPQAITVVLGIALIVAGIRTVKWATELKFG